MSQIKKFHLTYFIYRAHENDFYTYEEIAGLSGVPGLSIASNPESPIVFLKLEKSTGSSKADMDLLREIAGRVSNH